MPSEGSGPIRPSMTRHDRPLRAVSRHSYGTETLGSRLTPRLFGPTIGQKPGGVGSEHFPEDGKRLPEKLCESAGKPETRRMTIRTFTPIRVKKRAARPNSGRVGKSTTLDKGPPPALASFYPGETGLQEITPTVNSHQRSLAEVMRFMEITSARRRSGQAVP